MFDGARLKIERADHHIGNLNDEIVRFLQTEFYGLIFDADPQSPSGYRVGVEQRLPFPRSIPLILGDAVHNLRAALDISACEVVREFGGTVGNKTRFWFYDDRDKLESALANGVLQGFPDLLTLILDSGYFYSRSDNSLYGLHRLDLTDKHEMILPVISIADVAASNIQGHTIDDRFGYTHVLSGGKGTFQLQMTMNLSEVSRNLDKESLLRHFLFGPPSAIPGERGEANGDSKSSIEVLFGPGAFESRPVVPTLCQLSQLVGTVIDKFEQWVARKHV